MSTAVLERPSGVSNGTRDRWSHAYPDGSNVALCGVTRKGRPADGASGHCPDCMREAGRKSWVGR